MKCRVFISEAGIRDIEKMSSEIFSISQDKNITEAYISQLLEKIYKIADFPESGTPLYFNGYPTDYRYVIYKNYLAFYHISENDLIVDRIVYGKSNYCKILFESKN